VTPTTSRGPRPRSWKLPLAALAATAALAGGAQLLSAAPATAMVDDGQPCSTQFWIDQFLSCIVSDEDAAGGSGDGSGSGSGSGTSPGGQQPASKPRPECEKEGVICVDGTLAKKEAPKPKESSQPKSPVSIGGGPGRQRQQDNDAKLDRAEGKHGGSGGKPVACKPGQNANGCELTYKCVIEGSKVQRVQQLVSEEECKQLRAKLESEDGKAKKPTVAEDKIYCQRLIPKLLGLVADFQDHPVDTELLEFFEMQKAKHRCDRFRNLFKRWEAEANGVAEEAGGG